MFIEWDAVKKGMLIFLSFSPPGLMLKSDVYPRSRQQPDRPHPVPDGQDLLHGVEGHGGGLEWEAMEESLLQGEVRRVETLQNISLKSVTRNT